MPRLAVGSWAWVFGSYASRPVPLAQVARIVAGLGYEGLELTGRPHAHPDDLPTAAERRTLTHTLAAEGIVVASLGGPVGGGSPLVIEQADYLASVQHYLDFCADAEISALRVSSGRRPEGSAPAASTRLITVWGAAADLAAAANIRLLWEFEPNQAASDPMEVLQVLEGVNRPNFQVIFDLSHATVVAERHGGLPGGLPAFIRLLGRRIGRLHFADSAGDVDARGGSLRRALGQGTVDFPSALAACAAVGAGDDWWTLDLHGEADATATAREAKGFLDDMLRRYAELRA